MRTKIALISSLAALGALVPSAAWAADETPPSGGEAAAATPAVESPPAAPPVEKAPETPPAAPPPSAWPGWMRIDHDGGALQLWAGSTAPLADGIGLAFDLYVNSGFLGEFDIGPAISVGTLTLTPMIGAQFDWANRTFAALVPQLYLTGPAGPIYEELWVQYYNYKTVYDYTGKSPTPANSYLYLRAFVDYKISDYVGVGPQFELTNDFEAKEVISMPVGANVFFFQAGANSTFQAFLGYETKKTFSDNHLAGRLSYVHNF
jgi:hypothetical protein